MITLAVDTAGMSGGVAILHDLTLVGELFLSIRETHAQGLFRSMQWLLKRTGTEWRDISLLAVSSGPGSFTGLRIGLATVKGAAMSHSIPVKGVPSLDAMAAAVPAPRGAVLCPVIDARKKQVFTAVFVAGDQRDRHERVSEYMAIEPERLIEHVPCKKDVLLFGSGLSQWKEQLVQGMEDRCVCLPENFAISRASDIGRLAAKHIMAGNKPDDTAAITPVYVRLSEAEVSRLERSAKKSEDRGV